MLKWACAQAQRERALDLKMQMTNVTSARGRTSVGNEFVTNLKAKKIRNILNN